MAGEITYTSYRVPKLLNEGNVNGSMGSESSVITSETYLLKTGDIATGDYTFDTSTFKIDSTNHRVGFGATDPGTLVDINGALTIRGMTVPNVSNVGEGIIVFDVEASIFKISENGTAYRALVDSFWTTSSNNAIYNTNSGNVGIGHTNPPYKLTVITGIAAKNTTGSNGYITLSAGTDTHTGYIGWYKTGDVRIAYLGYGNSNLTLQLENSANFNIDGGNIGIGLSGVSATRMLEVQGTGYFNDYLYAHTHVGSDSYVSGFAGSGWKLEHTTGDATLTVDNLYVRKEMNVYELVINKIRATNGSLWVSDCAKLVAVVYVVGYVYQCFIDNDNGNIGVPFVTGDVLRCQKWTGRTVKYYSGEVTGGGTDYFTIEIKDGSSIPAVGDDVVRVGNNGANANRQGSIYLTASDTNAPYIDVLDGVTSYSFSGKTKVRLGKLTGITDPVYGALSGYGLYSENVYLTGWINATSGLIGGFTINSTDGLYAGSGSTRVQMKAGTGFWAGATAFADAPASISNAGVCKFLSGTIGGFQIGSDYIRSASSGKRVLLDATNNRCTFYANDTEYVRIDADATDGSKLDFVGDNYSCYLTNARFRMQPVGYSNYIQLSTYPGGSAVEVIFRNLPTDSTGLATGQIWKDASGYVRIV